MIRLIPLVVLPGMDGTGDLSTAFMHALGSEFQTQVVDYPPDEGLGYAELEARVRAVLPRQQDYVLMAESFSGPLGVSIAASRPPGLRALVLVCSFAGFPIHPPRWLRVALSALPFWRLPMAAVASLVLGRYATPAHTRCLRDAAGKVSAVAWRARVRAMLGADADKHLAAINVPVLCLRASRDRFVPASAVKPVLRTVRGARVVDIEGPHFLLLTAPEEAAQAVRQFVREVFGTSG